MDEGRPNSWGVVSHDTHVSGHLWGAWSEDDGKSWTYPKPTPLIHPGCRLCFSNCPMAKRSSLSITIGARSKPLISPATDLNITTAPKSGSPPPETEAAAGVNRNSYRDSSRALFDNIWRDFNTSYLDAFIDEGIINIFVPIVGNGSLS